MKSRFCELSQSDRPFLRVDGGDGDREAEGLFCRQNQAAATFDPVPVIRVLWPGESCEGALCAARGV